MRISTISLALTLLVACSGTETPDDTPTDVAPCVYPEGAAEQMALGQVLTAYSWPEARHADGRDLPLDLDRVFCDTDPDVDWGVHQALLFVSVPAW
ncbi:MAG: hypothetical protein AB8H79_24095 [Myxococcota bacterium]